VERQLPAVLATALALLAVAVAGAVVAFLPVEDVGRRAGDQVGEREVVRITAADGTAVEALGAVDTGSSASSIGREVATELGLDLEAAETVEVTTSAGPVERPVVDVVVTIAGDPRPVAVTVAERGQDQEPVLLGRDLLDGVTVAVGQERLTTPDVDAAPSALATFLSARSAAVTPASLLALLPLAAVLIVLLRSVVGVPTLGTFAPILLTVSFLQVGLLPSLALTGLVIAIGLVVEPVLRRTQLPRVARLAVLIAVTSAVLQSVEQVAGLVGAVDSWGAAFPLIVAAALVEKLYEEWELEGLPSAAMATLRTLGVAVVALPILVAPPVRFLATKVPIAFAVACGLWAWLAGTYRGLRLTELLRFGPTSTAATSGGAR